MRTLVTYRTFRGTSREYALRIAEAAGGSAVPFREASGKAIAQYDRIVAVSGTYAGWMPLTGFLKRRWKQLEGKMVIAVAVGAAPADHEGSRISYRRIPETIRERIEFFKLPGGLGDRVPSEEERRRALEPVLERVRGEV